MDVNQWAVCPRKRPRAQTRLFCFAPAGVGGSAFRGWGDFDDSIEAWLIQLPGREGRLREPAFTSMRELIPSLSDNLRWLMDRSCVFYGHSLGGMIAFEVARELRRSGGSQLSGLVVGAAGAPQVPRVHSPIHHLDEQAFLDEVQKRYGGIPRQIMEDAEIRALLVPALRSDVTILETYQYAPEAALDCDITAFGGLRDRMVTAESLDAWRQQTAGRFRLNMLDADHFFIQPARAELLASIGAITKASMASGVSANAGPGAGD